jgi:TPR repeat protein
VEHFTVVAENVYQRDGSTRYKTSELKQLDAKKVAYASKAASYLGLLYWRGEEGVKQDNSTARKWFTRAAESVPSISEFYRC